MPDLTEIYKQLNMIDNDIVNINNKITEIENFIFVSEFVEVFSTDLRLSHLGVGVVRTGITHSFFGIGALDHTQTLAGGTVYTLMTSAQYPPLALYVGTPTYTQGWLVSPTGTVLATMPVLLDGTSVRFVLDSQKPGVPANSTVRFTVALALISGTPAP